ncbi:MAG: PQQ-dependent sugar dehydrogenase [Chloroflexi bacterium]|nr:PQQ-dependent sugar dehydrogenase [Chloroflexota bacterium]
MRRALLLAAALLGALAGGCGGEGPPPPAPPATAATVPSEAQTAPPTAAADATPTAGGTAGIATTSVPATATATPTPTPIPTPPPAATPTPRAPETAERAPRAVHVVPALSGRRFDRPTDAAAYPGGRVLIAEQSGLVFLLDRSSGEGGIFLDLRREVSRDGNEEGLLGLALAPDFAASGHLYAYYSVREGARRTRLSRFTAAGGAAEPASELVILEVAQPFSNHNGGALRFGPDGMLYLGLGDGGSAGDPASNAQDPGTLLGSILRIDVRSASEAAPYRVPEDNPFVGVNGARGEVWAYGLRNPWRMAFDPENGTLWVGDVGQNSSEEVDVIVRGGNYGWNRLEGDACFRPPSGCDPGGTERPIATYGHREGCSITGGVVYRGDALPELDAAYVFGDFCSGRLWAMEASGAGPAVPVADTGASLTSFAQIGEELWMLRFGGPVLRAVSP